jgi:hypothetical protein
MSCPIGQNACPYMTMADWRIVLPALENPLGQETTCSVSGSVALQGSSQFRGLDRRVSAVRWRLEQITSGCALLELVFRLCGANAVYLLCDSNLSQ